MTGYDDMMEDGARGVSCPTCRAVVGAPCDVDATPHAKRVERATRSINFGVYQWPEARAAAAAERADIGGYPNASTDAIALVSCSAKKLDRAARARELYTSALFRLSVAYVTNVLRIPWFIVSARHGLVHPDTKIAPYDASVAKMRKRERSAWADRIRQSIRELRCWKVGKPPDRRTLTVLAGGEYAWAVCTMPGYVVHEPMRGLMIGQRLAWLKARAS